MTASVDLSYRAARGPQRLLFVCCALLAVILLGISGYFLWEWRTTARLETDGVRADAVVLSTSGQRATVTYRTPQGERATTIDRLGPTLCPEPGFRQRGCGPVSPGLTVPIVYDPGGRAPPHTVEGLGSGSWLNKGVVTIAVGLVLALLALGRWRWLRKLKALTGPDAPRTGVRIVHIKRPRRERKDQHGRTLMPMVRVRFVPIAAGGATLSTAVLSSAQLAGFSEGDLIDVVGHPRPGEAVAVRDGDGTLAFPSRKLRALRSVKAR